MMPLTLVYGAVNLGRVTNPAQLFVRYGQGRSRRPPSPPATGSPEAKLNGVGERSDRPIGNLSDCHCRNIPTPGPGEI